jgi:O-antigen/teichoic acid export membrane protein
LTQAPTTRHALVVNSAWLIMDRVVRMGLGLIVTIWMARQFGPETFGTWNYAMAFAALFGAFASLGLDGVVVRELIRDEPNAGAILGTAAALRLGAGILALAGSVLAISWSRSGQWLPILLVALNATVFMFQSSQVIDYHFQARMHSRPAVVAVNVAFLITSIGRLALLAIKAPIEWFGVLLIIEAAIAAALLVMVYRADVEARRPWRVDRRVARQLMAQSWPLLLSGLAVMVYMRLDQVMLASLAGDRAVGQFSAALRIAEVWYFIPMAIVTAAFPVMMEKKSEGRAAYERYVQRLYDGMAWLGIGVAIITTLVAPKLVTLLYGVQYAEAASVLSVQIWAGVAVAMSFVHGRWLLAEGLQQYNLLYTATGGCVNVGLNIVLIPRYGPVGAAWATLATQMAPVFLQLLLPKARPNFLLMSRALLAPYRLAVRRMPAP